MKIAYLILCHADPAHIARLATKLTSGANDCAVFVHVDAKSALAAEIAARLRDKDRVVLVEPSVAVWWGGNSAVDATYILLRAAFKAGAYDRFVLLQGADYPLMSNTAIKEFFEANPRTEFIRACNATLGKTKKIYPKSRYVLFYDRPNLMKAICNKITRILDIRLRDGRVGVGGKRWDIYWGCAQFALTRRAARYVLSREQDASLRSQFNTLFPADELYFHTLIFNSELALQTPFGGAEASIGDVTDARNLHYFEYPSLVKIFSAKDYEMLAARPEMFVRKVNSDVSAGLLDLIDAAHSKERRPELELQ